MTIITCANIEGLNVLSMHRYDERLMNCTYSGSPKRGRYTDHRSGYILVSGAGVRDVGWHWPREQPPLGVLAGAWKRRLRFVDTLARPGCRKKGRRGKTQYDPGRSRGSGVTVHEDFRLPICWAVDSAVVVNSSEKRRRARFRKYTYLACACVFVIFITDEISFVVPFGEFNISFLDCCCYWLHVFRR